MLFDELDNVDLQRPGQANTSNKFSNICNICAEHDCNLFGERIHQRSLQKEIANANSD